MSHRGKETTEDYQKYSAGSCGDTVGAWSNGGC